MTISPTEARFEAALQTFATQVGEATQFWFAATAMNEVARLKPDTLKALNLTPSFWITARVAMEYQAILTAGKIFGQRRRNPHNIDSFFDVLRANRNVIFSKEALAARKRRLSTNADEWLTEYLKRVYVPTARDINHLHELSMRHRKTYEVQYADVRNLHVAHNAITDPDQRWAMFQKTRIRDFERLIVFLNQLHDAVWNLYYNGEHAALRPMAYSVKRLVAKKLGELSRARTQEHIVAETRKCLALFTRGGTTLRRTEREALYAADA